jgi:hypothetical protein
MVFDESDSDMLVAMPLPLTDLFEDGLSPWEFGRDPLLYWMTSPTFIVARWTSSIL